MKDIPMEWIDKLFNCMENFYGERWTRYFGHSTNERLYKTIWKSGLMGLTYDQIKETLIFHKKLAANKQNFPPHVMEFFRVAKRCSIKEVA